MTSTTSDSYPEKTCDYFGFINDNKTAMGYPSPHNYCHQCQPPNTPSFAHQREFCLSMSFRDCPLFQSEKVGPMPKAIALEKSVRAKPSARKFVGSVAAIVVLVSLVGLGFFLPQFHTIDILNWFTAPAPTDTPSPSAALLTPTMTLTAKPTATIELPTMTATVAIPHALETPFGTGKKFLVHLVKEGDTLTALATTYSTSVDAIKAVNISNGALQINTLLIIPIGQTDAVSLAKIQVVTVDEETTTLQQIAQENHLTPEELGQLNQLPENTVFKRGDWVLVPVGGTQP